MAIRILVPLDGSSLAAAAFGTAQSVPSWRKETHVTLLRVVERTIAQQSVDPLDWHLQRSEAQAYLEQTSELLKEFLPCSTNDGLGEGRAANRIVDYAQSEGFDFLVFTSHGRGGLTGWNMSSVASKIAARAATSMLLVRPSASSVAQYEGGLQPVRYRRILVPLDGSQRAEHVLPMASALAERHTAELVLLHVVVKPELIQRMPLTDDEIELVDKVVSAISARLSTTSTSLAAGLPCARNAGPDRRRCGQCPAPLRERKRRRPCRSKCTRLYRSPAVGLWQPGDQLSHSWHRVHAHHAGHAMADRPNNQSENAAHTWKERGSAQISAQARSGKPIQL